HRRCRNRGSPAAAAARDRGWMAAFVPGAHPRGHDVRGAAAAARAEGGDDGSRPARHPRPQRSQGLLRAQGTLARGPAERPRAPEGADVSSRISHGMNGPEAIHELQLAVISTMNSVLAELYRDAGISPMQTYEAVVVGNVTMLHLLLGVDPSPLSMMPFTPAFMD